LSHENIAYICLVIPYTCPFPALLGTGPMPINFVDTAASRAASSKPHKDCKYCFVYSEFYCAT